MVVARAPTRVDLGGGWTDVPPYSTERGGAVCNLAIARYTTVRVGPAGGGPAPDRPPADAAAHAEAGRHSGTTGGGMLAAALRVAGMGARELDVTITSDFPVGAGLGGSSSAGVALVGALAAWRGDRLPPALLAELSRRIEVEELGIAGGRQDHYAAALGGVQLLEFGPAEHVEATALRPSVATLAALERRCVVAYTGEARVSATTITGVMDAYRGGSGSVATSLERMAGLARQMASAITRGDVDGLAALVEEQWAYQRSLHPAIPTPAIDAALSAARAAGALGGKALGASGGGCVLAIASDDDVDAVRRALAAHAALIPFELDRHGFEVLSDD